MTVRRLLRGFGVAVNVLVLVVSGVYLLVYLYRWEWNRAQISGTFFIIALVMLVATRIVSSLRHIDRRLDDLEDRVAARGPVGAAPGRRPARCAPERPWRTDLTDAADTIVNRHNRGHPGRRGRHPPGQRRPCGPALRLAARVDRGHGGVRADPDRRGAILSGLAYVIERMAGLLAGATVDRQTARMLAPELPLGPTRPLDELLVAGGAPPPRRMGPARVVGTVVVAGALIAGTVLVLKDATQSRAEPGTEMGTTTVELAISQNGGSRLTDELAEALWIACRQRLPEGTGVVEAQADRQSDTATLVVDRGMGPLQRRKFFGCLEDATLDRTTARVTGFEVTVTRPETGWPRGPPDSRQVEAEGHDGGDLLEVVVGSQQGRTGTEGHGGDHAVDQAPGCHTRATTGTVDAGGALEVAHRVDRQPVHRPHHALQVDEPALVLGSGQHLHHHRLGDGSLAEADQLHEPQVTGGAGGPVELHPGRGVHEDHGRRRRVSRRWRALLASPGSRRWSSAGRPGTGGPWRPPRSLCARRSGA